jgi:hypothetical protein
MFKPNGAKMNLLLYVIGPFVFFIVCATLVRHLRFLGHRGMTRTAFVAEFVILGVPEQISAKVYDYYKRESSSKTFAVSPRDSLADVFGRHDEVGLEDDIEDLFHGLSLRYPEELTLRQWQKPLETIRDMVLWLNWISQHQPT